MTKNNFQSFLNPDLFDKLAIGQEFYLDFTPVPPPAETEEPDH